MESLILSPFNSISYSPFDNVNKNEKNSGNSNLISHLS